MKRQEIGIVTGKMPQLSVFKLGALGVVVFLVMSGVMMSSWFNKGDRCGAQLKAAPGFDSWTDEQKDAAFKKCMGITTPKGS